ncbi:MULTISPECIES: hypothetical protein [Streptomyces]|uniref:hypothetical protein n=1 Tax=Streptomyces TaxID=1883 RepID=UPI00287FE4A4|nr:hypothetical protein [Streptomyces sp. CGMCC 4.1456]WNF61953.1 hypothetical protein RJD14_04850 [Streptomyces sp. CGMCC 4.1456]
MSRNEWSKWNPHQEPDTKASSHDSHRPQVERSNIASWWSHLSKVPKLLATLAAIAGITSAGILIYNSYFADKGPARFTGDLTSAKETRRLYSMLKKEDGHVVYLDTHCVYEDIKTSSCAWMTNTVEYYGGEDQGDGVGLTMLALTEDPDCKIEQEQETRTEYSTACPDTYWIHAFVNPGTGAWADNGEYGAGAVHIKGHFSVTVSGSDGLSPPEISHVELRSVRPEDVEQDS